MRTSIVLHSVLLAALAVAGGCAESTSLTTGLTSAGAKDEAAVVQKVTAGRPQRKTITVETTQPGRVEAFEVTPLYPKVTGYVDELLVDIGDRVKKGDLLLRLSVPELEDELAQKEALLRQADAEVKQAESARAAADAALETARAKQQQTEAGQARADADYDRWDAEHTRIRQLANSGSVTPKLADETRSQFRAAAAGREEAKAAVVSAEAAVAEAQARVESAAADVTAAEARRDVAAANLKRTQTLADYREIRAPFDGVVTVRNVDTGHFVEPVNGGSKPLMVVARNDKLRIFVDLPEDEAALAETGDRAIVRVQAMRNAEIVGTVTRTSWALDERNRSLRVEVDLENREGALRPGMYATVTILLAERENALVLPVAAIVREGGDSFCYLVESGRTVRRPIEVGLRSGGEVEIRSGLAGNETVVLARAESLKGEQAAEVLQPEK